MSNNEKFKHNRDLLEAQQRDFAKNGSLLKKLFSVSVEHPLLSVIFALSFGALVNALYDLASYPLTNDQPSQEGMLVRGGLVLLFSLVCWWMVVRLKALNPSMFVDTPLSEKKLLVTLVSKGKRSYKDAPAYVTYESLLYTDGGHANINSLQKVVLVTTELPEVTATANQLKQHIEASGRQAEIYSISINDRSLMEIQDQFKLLFKKYEAEHPANELLADYTGGTKDMSVALLRESEKRLVTPVYLKSATDGEYGKASL